MDRFESHGLQCTYYTFFNLHSNMDRFERRFPYSQERLQLNLHSNMDRFERIAVRGEFEGLQKFTFQYG